MVRQEERPWQGQASILLDLRAAGHVRAAVVPGADERTYDSLEWAVSAAASIGAALLRADRDVWLLGDSGALERTRFGSATRFVDHLAAVTPTRRADLVGFAGPVRAATRDSIAVAVLGRLDGRSVEALADAHPHGWSAPAYAILLDVDTWTGAPPAARGTGCEAAADVLRSAGWRVAVARNDDSVRTVWRILVSGRPALPAVVP
jgi:hypothetical protein